MGFFDQMNKTLTTAKTLTQPKPAAPALPATPAMPSLPPMLGNIQNNVSTAQQLTHVNPANTFNPVTAASAVTNNVQNLAKPSTNPSLAMAQATPVQKPIIGIKSAPVGATAAQQLGSQMFKNPGSVSATAGGSPAQAPFDAVGQVTANTEAAAALADKFGIGKQGSLGRIDDDPRIKELLDKEKAGMDGMTPAEMQAAKEQGMAGINQQLGTNMQQMNDLASANGVRGGSAMGLQMQAMGQAQDASGQLSRQLILDNLNQKNIGIDRYGNTIMGVANSNMTQLDKEKAAQLAAIQGFGSQIDAASSGNKSDILNDKQTGILQKYLDGLGQGGGSGSGVTDNGVSTNSTSGGKTAVQIGEKGSGFTGSAPAEYSTSITNSIKSGALTSSGAAKAINTAPELFRKDDGTTMTPDEALEAAKVSNTIALRIYAATQGDPNSSTSTAYNFYTKVLGKTPEETNGILGDSGGKIICTEAFRQGLITEEKWQVTQRYRKLLTMREYKGYLFWATPVVRWMKASPRFSRAILPFVKNMIEGERYALGEVAAIPVSAHAVAKLVKVLNYTGAFLRSLSIKVKGYVHG